MSQNGLRARCSTAVDADISINCSIIQATVYVRRSSVSGFEVFLTVRIFVHMFSLYLRAADSVVLTLPFLFVNCNFLDVNFSMSVDELNDDSGCLDS